MNNTNHSFNSLQKQLIEAAIKADFASIARLIRRGANPHKINWSKIYTSYNDLSPKSKKIISEMILVTEGK